MKIFVGNLAHQVTDDELKVAFEAHGEVESARVITDRDTGRSRGFGFVEMLNEEQGKAAIEALNGTEFVGRTLTVNVAYPPKERRSFGGGNRRNSGGAGGYRRGGHSDSKRRY